MELGFYTIPQNRRWVAGERWKSCRRNETVWNGHNRDSVKKSRREGRGFGHVRYRISLLNALSRLRFRPSGFDLVVRIIDEFTCIWRRSRVASLKADFGHGYTYSVVFE